MRNTVYTDFFGGTSAAAPLVAGVIALMLSANPD
ncbi:S8 family serine peptidase [Streptomyces albogriseolus]